MPHLIKLLGILIAIIGLQSGLCAQQDFRMDMKQAINKARAKGCYCGNAYYHAASPLTWNDQLEESAIKHAKDMSRERYFNHRSKNGDGPWDRADKVGYDWQLIAENLGIGQTSIPEVVRDWLDSVSHCEALMNPRLREMGAARYNQYWVLELGKPMPRAVQR